MIPNGIKIARRSATKAHSEIKNKFPGINHSQLAKMFYIPETYEWLFKHNKADRKLYNDVKINVSIMNMAYQNIDRSANKIVISDPIKVVTQDTSSLMKDTSNVASEPVATATTPAATPAKSVQTSTHTSSPKYHTVKKGDTLYAIARKYHTTVDKLCKLNKIKETSILSLGQKIKVK